jgi:hypothetical protein
MAILTVRIAAEPPALAAIANPVSRFIPVKAR